MSSRSTNFLSSLKKNESRDQSIREIRRPFAYIVPRWLEWPTVNCRWPVNCEKKRRVLPSEKIEKRKNSNKSVPHHFSLAASFPYFDSLKFTNDERWIERAEKIHSLHQTPPFIGGGVKYTDEQHDPYHPVCLWRAELKQKIKITFLVSRENP